MPSPFVKTRGGGAAPVEPVWSEPSAAPVLVLPPQRTRPIAPAIEPPEPPGPRSTPTLIQQDKKRGDVPWRDVLRSMTAQQEAKRARGWTQDRANPRIDTDRPICIVIISDTHIGSWATNYQLFETITQELLEIPDLFTILAGDLVNMAIKLRNVAEVHDDGLTPPEQLDVLEGWLAEIEHKVIAACWGNHEERGEVLAGSDAAARILSRKVVYHSGIGHIDLEVGAQTYKLAVSHHFQGRSIYSPVHGPQRYLVTQAPSREIAICGDSHVPGMMKFAMEDGPRLAINAGTIQTNSGYAKRYFSLTTHPVFPCLTLDPRDHLFTPYWSVREWLATKRA